ncbi:hypothetical protein V492_00135 [Pseudogymnoascus sp. VKM F-4246]|nr:hypothetical protein V492_00135 [Pseudogymnoascus sp. VKM F-4246]
MRDVNRIGFTLLSSSEGAGNGPYRVNVLFVHGLRGHPRHTWEDGRGSSSNQNTATPKKWKTFRPLFKKSVLAVDNTSGDSAPERLFWLEEFLTLDIPEARVWTYGYNADVIGGVFQANNKNSVSQHGRDLAVKLEREIENEDPIIIVAHSLGGIVVKDALRRSDICRSRTKAIIFLGTPHRGSSYAGWGAIASKLAKVALQDSNKKIVDTLEVNSEVLDNIHEEFKTIVHISSIKIHSFQEARGISGVKGLHNKVVDDFSSKLDLPQTLETVEGMDANHMEMARCFNRADPRYRAILGLLRKFIRPMVSCANSRPQNMPSMSDFETLTTATQVPLTSGEPNGPLRVLPFGRNRDFVGRQSELNQLIKTLHTEDTEEDCQRAALVGLGGVGKTQIALECAFQLQSTSPTCSVFWVQASDATSFDNAYRNIARQLKIPGFENEKADVKRLVKTRLSQESSGKWLMVVDNADKYEMFYGSKYDNGSCALSEYLPFSTLGAILFTTRDREAATKYAGSNVIPIDQMDDSESEELLQRSLQNKQLIEDKDSITRLLKLLVNLPLAIMQSAAYLNAKGSTIGEYIRIYEESGENVIKLLSKDFEDVRRYPGMKNPIATTWLISFEQIQVRNPLAADYMAFISCVKEQDIPRSLLPLASEFDKMEALGTLRAFGFIKEHLGGASYDIHRLVHTAMQNWLQLKNEWRSWNEKTLKQITNVFPWPQYENRDMWMACLPHAQCAIASFEKTFAGTKDLPWRLLCYLGVCSGLQGKYAQAEALQRQALQLQETVLGKDHPYTLTNMSYVAESLRQQGKYAQAEALQRQTLQLQETVLGKDHLDTLISMASITLTLRQQGKYIEADAMQRQTLQLQETVLGKDHPHTLFSMAGIALTLHQQDKYAETEAMQRQTLQLQETVLGKDHPDTLFSVALIVIMLRQQGKYAEAEAMQRQALQLQETVLGKDHPHTLFSMTGIAESLSQQGKYVEAEAIHRLALQLQEAVLGEDHPDKLSSMTGIAESLSKQGKYAETETMHRQVLQLRETVLGKDHPRTLSSMSNVAGSLSQQGKYADAEAMQRQVLQLRETVLGKDHPDTLFSMADIALTLHQLNKYAEADAMRQQALQLLETVRGKAMHQQAL